MPWFCLKEIKPGIYSLVVFKNNFLKDSPKVFDRDFDRDAMNRAKKTCLDLCWNNRFLMFSTFTFDRKKVVDRSDFESVKKKFLQFFRNYQKKYACKVKYVIVPELHSDKKGFHFHCLLSGLDDAKLSFRAGDFMYMKDGKKIFAKYDTWVSPSFLDKFGANSSVYIENYNDFVVWYITKYMLKSDERIFYHRYFRSKLLQRSCKPKWGFDVEPVGLVPSFQNNFCFTYEVSGDVADHYKNLISDYGGF